MTRPPGIYHDIPEDDYHADNAISQSALKVLIDKSPAHYLWARSHPTEPTDAMRLGTLVHAKVLGTPIPFDVFQHPGNIKAGKVEREEAKAAGRVGLNASVHALADDIAEAVLADALARKLLERPGHSEVSMWWREGVDIVDRDGQPHTVTIDLRARLDRVNDLDGIDLKTCSSARSDDLYWHCRKYGYHVQDEHYTVGRAALGLPSDPLLFVFVETDPPHDVVVRHLGAELRAEGAEKRTTALTTLAECIHSGEWPGYPGDILPIIRP